MGLCGLFAFAAMEKRKVCQSDGNISFKGTLHLELRTQKNLPRIQIIITLQLNIED